MRAKEFLSVRGIEFESINVAGDPAGAKLLADLGARTVPVVSKGEQWVHALRTAEIIELLELSESTEPALSAQTLIDRLDNVLDGSMRFTQQFSDDQLNLKLSNRDRSYRVICHHIFQIPQSFLDYVEQGSTIKSLTYEELVAPPGPEHQTADGIAQFGESVKKRLATWRETLTEDRVKETVSTYYGDQSLHELLERTTWHSGQHSRQIMSLLEQLGTTPDRPLGVETFADLPMPNKVWDD